MNSSVYSADRATHLRVVAVALMASIAIVGFAISARVNSIEAAQTTHANRPQTATILSTEAVATSPLGPRG